VSDVVVMTHRPLATVARPATGRPPAWAVLFGTVDRALMSWGAGHLIGVLQEQTGPTRCGPVVVQPALDEEMAALYLASPVCRHLSVSTVEQVLVDLRTAGPGAVLLVAHCRVLWRQQLRMRPWS